MGILSLLWGPDLRLHFLLLEAEEVTERRAFAGHSKGHLCNLHSMGVYPSSVPFHGAYLLFGCRFLFGAVFFFLLLMGCIYGAPLFVRVAFSIYKK